MKNIILIFFIAIITPNIYGQNWLTDFDQAKKIATEENKTIILVFQGSDWCAPCIKLDKKIWRTNDFISYADEHFVMLKADFPKRKKNALSPIQEAHNASLAETYNSNGYFPNVVVLDNLGKVLGSTGYQKVSPIAYINILSSF